MLGFTIRYLDVSIGVSISISGGGVVVVVVMACAFFLWSGIRRGGSCVHVNAWIASDDHGLLRVLNLVFCLDDRVGLNCETYSIL